MKKIKWHDCEGKVADKDLLFLSEKHGITLPESFVEFVKDCDGGYPEKSSFTYYDEYFNNMCGSAIGQFLSISSSNSSSRFLENIEDPPEFFPEGLVAFAETGGGDFICFDYRQGKDNPDPAIVYWSHGADVGKDVSFIAKNFEEFLDMLQEPEEE